MGQFLLNGLCQAGVYSLVAVGFGMIFFATRIFHVAHGAVYTTAGFVCYLLLITLGLGLPVAVIGGVLSAAILGILVELFVYYPLVNPRKGKHASPAILMVSSLGVYTAVVNIIAMLAGNDTKVLRPGVDMTFEFGQIILSRLQLVQLITAVVVLTALWLALKFSHFGRTIRALSEDAELVSILGHNTRVLRLIIFALGSGLAGLGGVLVSLDMGMDPQVGFEAVLVAAVATIVGGFGRFLAPALGALILGVLQAIVVWQTSQKWSTAVVFAVLIVVLLVKPSGLLCPRKRLEEEA